MKEVWDRAFKSDKTFFGEEHSNFALLCLNGVKTNNVQKIEYMPHTRAFVYYAYSYKLERNGFVYMFGSHGSSRHNVLTDSLTC